MIVVAAENALYGSTDHTKPKQFINSSNTVIIPPPHCDNHCDNYCKLLNNFGAKGKKSIVYEKKV